MRKITLSFKVDPRLKRALENLAAQENRSLSNYVVTTLIRHLESLNVEWKKETVGSGK